MFKKSSFLYLSFFLSYVCFYADKGEQWKGSVKTEQGVVIVKNPQEPLFDEAILEFKEELLIPESDGKNYIFVKLSSLALDEDNNIYVLDSGEVNIKVFNQYGKYLRTFGRKGQGPGELDVPFLVGVHKNEIMVGDAGNRRITFLSLAGKYKRSLSMARSYIRGMKIDSKGSIFGIVRKVLQGEIRFELQKFDSELNYLKTFDYIDIPVEKEPALFMAGPCFNILKGDMIAWGFPERDYEINIFNSEGVLIKRILREYIPDRIPQEEIKFATKNTSLVFYIPKYYSAYYGINGDDLGRIITLVRYKLIEKVIYFDFFSPEGKYLTQKSLKVDIYTPGCIWKNDRLYTVGNDEDGLPVMRIYQIIWKNSGTTISTNI